MQMRFWITAACVWLGLAASAAAQFKQGEPDGAKVGEAQVTRWRAGMIVKAVGGPCKGISGYAPVPTDWPEQQVQVIEEDNTPGVKTQYETVDGGVKIMNVKIALIEANAEARAIVTVEVRRNIILPPDNTDIYVKADPKKLPREIKIYLAPSPKIECKDAKIRALAREIGVDKEKAWEHVEAIYDWVREKVKYRERAAEGRVGGVAATAPAIARS